MKTKIEAKARASASAVYRAKVICAESGKTIFQSEDQKNLILLNPVQGQSIVRQMEFAHAGTGNAANKFALAGTFQQTGTTVTRATGTGVFESANVNDFIRFATGERARILTFVNATQVTVDRSQTVSAAIATIYKTSRIILQTPVKTAAKNGNPAFSRDDQAGSVTYTGSYNFSTETVARTYLEVGFGNTTSQVFGRLVLESPINVGIGQFLQLEIKMTWTATNYRVSEPIEVDVVGWPLRYPITQITSTATFFEVTLSRAHNYSVGGKFNISGALPTRFTIDQITSNGTSFTITTIQDHGMIVGNSIQIEGSAIAGYNAQWVVASAPTTTIITVTSAANLGTSAGGTVRRAVPATWFDGEHTIASIPSTTTIRVTNANNIISAGPTGEVFNNTKASAIIAGLPFGASNGGNSPSFLEPFANPAVRLYYFSEANIKTGMAFGSSPNPLLNPNNGFITTGLFRSYDAQTLTQTIGFNITANEFNIEKLRQIAFQNDTGVGAFFVTFEEPQRKEDQFSLTIQYQVSWEPSLD